MCVPLRLQRCLTAAQIGIDFAQFDGISSDVEFMRKLMNEQSVMCLPASVFRCPGFFRLVLTVPFVGHARAGRRHSLQRRTRPKRPLGALRPSAPATARQRRRF